MKGDFMTVSKRSTPRRRLLVYSVTAATFLGLGSGAYYVATGKPPAQQLADAKASVFRLSESDDPSDAQQQQLADEMAERQRQALEDLVRNTADKDFQDWLYAGQEGWAELTKEYAAKAEAVFGPGSFDADWNKIMWPPVVQHSMRNEMVRRTHGTLQAMRDHRLYPDCAVNWGPEEGDPMTIYYNVVVLDAMKGRLELSRQNEHVANLYLRLRYRRDLTGIPYLVEVRAYANTNHFESPPVPRAEGLQGILWEAKEDYEASRWLSYRPCTKNDELRARENRTKGDKMLTSQFTVKPVFIERRSVRTRRTYKTFSNWSVGNWYRSGAVTPENSRWFDE